jgi:hypothetical protein
MIAGSIQMTPHQWALVKDNPIQRDTVAHAKKAENAHLKKSSSAQLIVHAAILPDQSLIKLDGHTRSLLWQEGRLSAPEAVHVMLHKVSSIEDAIELYKHFDNPSATENAGDRLSGAYRKHALTPTSWLLRHGGITSALNLLGSSPNVYDAVGVWKQELQLLDEMDAHNSVMPGPLIAAALATLRKHGPKALDFWRLYAAGGGTKVDGHSCGAQELHRVVLELRARHQLVGGWKTRMLQAGKAVSCCEAWLCNRTFTVGAKSTDFKAYVESLPSKK